MDLRQIVKRAPFVLYVIAAVGGMLFGVLHVLAAYVNAAAHSTATVSPDEHAVVIRTLMLGLGAILFSISQAAHALRSWPAP